MEHPKSLEDFPSKDHAIWRPSPLGPPALFLAEPKADDPELRLGVEACRLVGLDPDQLSLQAPLLRRIAGANGPARQWPGNFRPVGWCSGTGKNLGVLTEIPPLWFAGA